MENYQIYMSPHRADSKIDKTLRRRWIRQCKIFIGFILALFGFLLALSGCSGTSDYPVVKKTLDVVTSEEKPWGLKTFGETETYPNDINISVSAPESFVPTDMAFMNGEGTPLVFRFTLTNNSDDIFEPNTTYASLQSGGVEGAFVADTGNPVGQVGLQPTTALLPGQSVEWLMGFTVADPTNIVLQTSLGYQFKNVIFTNVETE